MELKAINIGLAPEPGPDSVGLVGMPVWMWAASPDDHTFGPITASASAGGITITATARVHKVTWDMGDGTEVVCRNAGTPYRPEYGKQESPNCGHVYATSSSREQDGKFTVTASSDWVVEWTGAGQSGVIRLNGLTAIGRDRGRGSAGARAVAGAATGEVSNMTSTTTRDGRSVDHGSTPPSPPLVPPPKLRRRPALVAGAVAAICLGALLAAWAWTSTTNTQEVLVARSTIERGSLIKEDDLARVRISADPALSPVAASAFDDLVGKRAALDIAEGGLITAGATTTETVPEDGASIVGVALSPAQSPGMALQAGDRVRLVVTPPPGGEQSSGPPAFNDAEVVEVNYDSESGVMVVDVLVPHADATVLAARAATGNVALVLDSRER